MFQGSYVYPQIASLISHKQFQPLVNRHNGKYKVKDFTCWKQFLCMAFGQLSHRESLSDTMLCLKANNGKLYHLGIGAMSLKTAIPEFIFFSAAAVHDVNVLDFISFEANSFYVMDRGYIDSKWLYRVHLSSAFFITSAKDNLNFRRLYSRKACKNKGALCD